MPIRRLANRLWGQAYVVLALVALMWGANAIAGRLAVGQVSPMVLTTARWIFACLVLAAYARDDVMRDLPQLLPRWKTVLWMGALGFTAFNALFYEAAHRTTAVNITILQGAIPVLVLLGALLFYRTRITPMQVAGMAITILGVGALATEGDLETLKTMSFNIGDVWMMVACLFYALYTLGLRNRPPVAGLSFFTAMAGVAAVTSLPLLAFEIARGDVVWPTTTGWLIIVYVGLFPSLLAQIMFIRGVELIGPGRAGVFVNLVPVFGAMLAVLILREPFTLSSAVALALVLGGIFVAERLGKR
jgi:drug/metabolite transporter (DMT)-like permease